MRKITKPDVTRTDIEYWERVLESHGLGEKQLGLTEEPEETDNGSLEEVDGQ